MRSLALFEKWKSECNSSYSSATEESQRFANFQCSVRYADGSGMVDSDADEYGRLVHFSGWADLSDAEMERLTGSHPDGMKHNGRRGTNEESTLVDWHWSITSSVGGFVQSYVVATPPPDVNWRTHSTTVVTQAKSQVRWRKNQLKLALASSIRHLNRETVVDVGPLQPPGQSSIRSHQILASICILAT